MKENGSEVFYEILGKERGTKELYHAEDEKDLTKVSCDLHLYEVYVKGFIEGCGGAQMKMGRQGVQSVRMNDLKHIRGKCSVVKYRQMQSVCIIH